MRRLGGRGGGKGRRWLYIYIVHGYQENCVILLFLIIVSLFVMLDIFPLPHQSPTNFIPPYPPPPPPPPASHGLLAMGGYALPSFSTLGSQTQRSSAGMLSMTTSTWAPQPHQVAFSEGESVGT